MQGECGGECRVERRRGMPVRRTGLFVVETVAAEWSHRTGRPARGPPGQATLEGRAAPAAARDEAGQVPDGPFICKAMNLR